jgi:ABC-type transporter MlaC component
VEEAVRGYFKALDAGNFAKAYSYLDLSPSAARSFGFQSQQEFVNYWHLSGLTGIVINSLKVKNLSEHTAIVTVSVEEQFGDTAKQVIVDFRMEKRKGQWKITG